MTRTQLLLLLCLGACSPYEFSKEVGGFSTGVDQLKSAVTSGYANLTADRIALLQQDQIDRRARVDVPPSCNVLVASRPASKEPCVMLAKDQTALISTDVQGTQADALDAIKMLAGYARALADVTNAADRTAYDAATKRLAASVGHLASAAKMVAPGADAVAPAFVNLVAWVGGAALDQDRFDTLQRSVSLAKKPVEDVAGALEQGLVMLTRARVRVMVHATENLAAPLGPALSPAAYKERFSQAEVVRAKLDALRHSDPKGAASELVSAHNALFAAVNNPKSNFADVMTVVAEFEEKAKGVRDALAASTK